MFQTIESARIMESLSRSILKLANDCSVVLEEIHGDYTVYGEPENIEKFMKGMEDIWLSVKGC